MLITERIDNVTTIQKDYLTVTPPFPKAIKIELTNICNLKCWFCGTKDERRHKKFMDFELYKSIIDKLIASGITEFGLFYLGESTLYPHFIDAIKYARQKGATYIFLTTNGVLLNEELIRNMFNAGLNSLKFSMNAFSDEDMFKATGVKGYTQQLENLKTAKKVKDELGCNVGIYTSTIFRISPELQQKQEEAFETWKPYTDEQYWLPLYNQAYYIKNEKIVGGNRGRLDNLQPPIPCWALFKQGHITVDGKLAACCFDHNEDFIMGDLKTQSFEECWNSKVFQQLRLAHLTKNIKGCACERCLKRIKVKE